jgi:hypothetical protein
MTIRYATLRSTQLTIQLRSHLFLIIRSAKRERETRKKKPKDPIQRSPAPDVYLKIPQSSCMRRQTWKVRERKWKKNRFESMLLLLLMLLLTELVFEFDVVIALNLQWRR